MLVSRGMELEANKITTVTPHHDHHPHRDPSPLPLRDARAEFDREYLSRVLRSTGGDVRRAAAIAEIHPKSFERLMRRRGVRRP